MASKSNTLCLAIVLVTMFWSGAIAQSGSGCTNAIIGLSPCMNYITGNSSTPSPSCCSKLDSVVQSQPQCLCSVLNGGGVSLGLSINQTLALQLPGACNVQTPSVSQCNSAGSPAISPPGFTADSPSDAVPDTPDTPENNVPAGGGSKTTPAIDGGFASHGIMPKASIHFGVSIFFFVFCVSTLAYF